jgi:hypothetical protein
MASPVASALERLIPASLAAAIVVVLFVALIGSAVALFSMPLSIWTDRLPEIWHEMQRHLLDWRTVFDTLGGVQEQIRNIAGGKAEMTVDIADTSTVQEIATLAPTLVAQIVLFLASLYFFLATRHSIRASVLSLCFSRHSRLRTARMFRDAEWFVSRYLLSITVINACLGAATTLAMWMLDVPQPYLWGMLAFCLNYIVYIGRGYHGPDPARGRTGDVGYATGDLPADGSLSDAQHDRGAIRHASGHRTIGHSQPVLRLPVAVILDLDLGSGGWIACRAVPADRQCRDQKLPA